MPNVWMQDDEGWAILTLNPAVSGYELIDSSAPNDGVEVRALTESDRDCTDATASVRLLSAGMDGSETWVLLCQPDAVLINGEPLTTGCRVLHDRDEIRMKGAKRAFFSTEAEACITPYPGEDRPICPRDRTEIECGTPAVRCPSCGIWYHQGDTPCFTYLDTCATCSQPTELGGGLRWSPEGL